MRVVSGACRGLKLETIVEDGIRPTTDKIKESIFNILQFEIQGKRFLDLFGGSGQIGIEAASRGADEVIIVEKNPCALNVIKRNVSKLQNRFNIKVINADAVDYLINSKNNLDSKVDIAFLDPPYKSNFWPLISEHINSVVKDSGTVITETSLNAEHRSTIGIFKNTKSYKYGNIQVNFYKI